MRIKFSFLLTIVLCVTITVGCSERLTPLPNPCGLSTEGIADCPPFYIENPPDDGVSELTLPKRSFCAGDSIYIDYQGYYDCGTGSLSTSFQSRTDEVMLYKGNTAVTPVIVGWPQPQSWDDFALVWVGLESQYTEVSGFVCSLPVGLEEGCCYSIRMSKYGGWDNCTFSTPYFCISGVPRSW